MGQEAVDWKARYFEAVAALLAMEHRAEDSQRALDELRAFFENPVGAWRLNPSLRAYIEDESKITGSDRGRSMALRRYELDRHRKIAHYQSEV